MYNESCDDRSFGPEIHNCRSNFDFTLLFEQSILSLAPSIIFLGFAAWRIQQLYRQNVKTLLTPLYYAKLGVIAVYAILELVLLVLWAREPQRDQTQVTIAASVFSLLDSITVCLLSHVEHKRSLHPSDVINVYLLFSCAFDAVQARTLWLKHDVQSVAAVLTATIPIKLVLLVLEAKEKRDFLLPEYKGSSPESLSGVLNRRFYLWVLPLFKIGFRNIISFEDLFPIDEKLESPKLLVQLKTKFAKHDKKSKNALFFCIFKTFKSPFLAAVPPRLALTGFLFSQPFLINQVVKFAEKPKDEKNKNVGYGLIGATALIYAGIAISRGYYFQKLYQLLTIFRGALVSVIYDKTLELADDTRDDSAALTLMSTDVESINTSYILIHELWAGLFDGVLGLVLLQRQLGVACVVPVITAIACTVITSHMSKYMGPRKKIWNQAVQTRVGLTSSVLGSMKGVKIMGMGQSITEDIHQLRVKELDYSKKFRILNVWLNVLANFPTFISPFLTFAIFSAIGGNDIQLTAANAFTSLSIILLMTEPLSMALVSVSLVMTSLGAFERIQEFLLRKSEKRFVEFESEDRTDADSMDMDEDLKSGLRMTVLAGSKTQQQPASKVVEIDRASFGKRADESPILHDVNLNIYNSQLTMIIGRVASGKSTLLKAILGEVKNTRGNIDTNYTAAAYCDQEPWLINADIQQNITARGPINREWYDEVVDACALNRDFHQLPYGDLTNIGSKGISLSGGQKQRVALARAIYSRERFVVLDDVLAGLDYTTEEHVFSRVLGPKGILRQQNISVVFATHAIHRARFADHVVVLGLDGSIVDQGTAVQVASRSALIQDAIANVLKTDEIEQEQTTNNQIAKKEVIKPRASSEEFQDMNRRTGDMSVYKYWFKTIGVTMALTLVLLEATATFFMIFPSIWLKWWAAYDSEHHGKKRGFWIGIYGTIAVLNNISFAFPIWFLFVVLTPKFAVKLHRILLDAVMKAPFAFFVATDSGVTLNRFSQDMSLIDMQLPSAAVKTLIAGFGSVASAIVISTTSKYLAIAVPPACMVVYMIQKFYLRTSRQLRFLDLEAKSPLYTHFGETLKGLSTIRAFGWQGAAKRRNIEDLDRSQRPYYLLYCIQCWLNLVLDLLITGIALLLVTLAVEVKSTAGGLIGLALINVLTFNIYLSELVTSWTQLETSLGAIARVKNFEEKTESEDKPGENQTPPIDWPSRGHFIIDNISASYSPDSAPALQNVTLDFGAGQKIGICGRTGSGKSSFILALYRLLDISTGSITLDGFDLATVPRQLIRSKLIAIPQEPFLRPGTVHLNIDPLSTASTEAIITVLTRVGLWETVSKHGGIETDIESLSLTPGQRQLFCLATAMLRKGSVLILDEATSSVDVETDIMMQKLIREEFQQSTVITVAHKLDTILDADKVLVMDKGRVLEFENPQVLLARKSAFRDLYNSQR